MKLTQENVEGMKPELKRIEIPDDRQPGLYLIVQPSGAKSWAVRYRFDGKPRKFTIGSCPRFSLTSARKLAQDALFKAGRGNCPAEQKQAARASKSCGGAPQTIGELTETFMAQHVKKRLRERSQREIGCLLRKELAPLENRRIDSIKKADIRTMLGRLEDTPVQANRLLTHTKKLFNWAVENDFLESSPCENLRQPHTEQARTRVLTDDELRLVLCAAGRLEPIYGAYLRLLIHLLARRKEIACMSWAEIDFKAATWTLPAARAKNKREHTLPLPNAAMAILESLKDKSLDLPSPFVFPSPVRTGSGLIKVKRQIDGLIEGEPIPDWRFHDLRRTGASSLARFGIPRAVCEKILNHRSGAFAGVAGVYDRYDYFKEMRAALERYANFLAGIEHGSNVVDLDAAPKGALRF
jgi:integrase